MSGAVVSPYLNHGATVTSDFVHGDPDTEKTDTNPSPHGYWTLDTRLPVIAHTVNNCVARSLEIPYGGALLVRPDGPVSTVYARGILTSAGHSP